MARRGEIDWSAAFTFYAGLGPTRTFAQVAARFGCSETAVRKAARRDGWAHRADDMDAEAARRAEERGIRSLADRMVDMVKLSEATRQVYVQALRDGKIVPTPSDLVAMAKLELLLGGEADSRTEVSVLSAAAEIAAMDDRTLEEELDEMRRAADAIAATKLVVPEMTMDAPPVDDSEAAT